MTDNQQDPSTNSLVTDTQSEDEFLRVTAAHQTLIEGNSNFIVISFRQRKLLAQTCEEQNNYPLALQLYRICVDFLLEELMFAEGTDQSRIYLREKCTAIMDRIDLLKNKLPSIESSATTTTDSIPVLDQLQLSDENSTE